MLSPLSREFFLPPPDVVARALLGAVLLRDWQGVTLAGRIVETEAYFGTGDAAAHAFRGRTPRNAVLFGPPGHAYVYNIYGLHACLNVSCEPEGQAGCVLIRALEPLGPPSALEAMARLRQLPTNSEPRLLTSGPGRLCQAFAITRPTCNGLDLLDPASPLRLGFDLDTDTATVTDYDAQAASMPDKPAFAVSPRIGIRKAAELPLRFSLANHPCVSKPWPRT